MGLGIVFGSIISAVADKTGDDSSDAVVKIKRLTNEKGWEFCALGNFPFLRSDISFNITTSAYQYSGASYLPTTFKRVTAAFLLDGVDRYPLDEVGIQDAYNWANPDDNTGRPDKFCITRIESGYWEVQFNRKPDQTYTIYFEIELQWTDLSATTDEAVITKQYFPAFSHYISMARFIQQGDVENYSIAKAEWYNPMLPKSSILGILLSSLINPMNKKRVVVDMGKSGHIPHVVKSDYNKGFEQ
jgi:hypothetical protein